MSEDNRNTSGHVRRRVSRQAGPPGGDRKTDVVSETVAASDPTVKLGTELDSSKSADTTVKLHHSEPVDADDATVKLEAESPNRAEGTDPKSSSGDADATEKIETSKAGDESTAQLPADNDEAEPKKKLGKLGWTAAVVAVLSLVLLIGSGGFYFYHDAQADSVAQRRADYVQTAKQTVLNLTNIKGDTAEQDIDRVLAVSSGQLKKEYSERKDAYAKVVQQAKVKASGEVIEAALESGDDHTARVLVAAKQTLTNAGSPDPQQRYYRFRITLTRENGQTTASQVEFVA